MAPDTISNLSVKSFRKQMLILFHSLQFSLCNSAFKKPVDMQTPH